MTRSSCYNQELNAPTFVRVEIVATAIRRCIYSLPPCVAVHFEEFDRLTKLLGMRQTSDSDLLIVVMKIRTSNCFQEQELPTIQ